MAEHSFESLSSQNVTQLREIAGGVDHEAVAGYSTMHKEHLVEALCKAFGIEARPQHMIVGIDKATVKKQIRALKAKRAAALEAGDKKQLQFTRRRIHELKRKIHRAMV